MDTKSKITRKDAIERALIELDHAIENDNFVASNGRVGDARRILKAASKADAQLIEALEEIIEYPLNVEGYNSLDAVRLRFVAMQGIARAALAKAGV